MNTTIKPRIRKEKGLQVFRTPQPLADYVHGCFYAIAHKSKLTEGTSIFAHRLIREETFSRADLLAIRGIMTDREAETTEISKEVLGGSQTLEWIASVLD